MRISMSVMNKATNNRVKYISQDHIFTVDLSGRMDKGKLAGISEALRDCMKSNLISNKAIKFLFDFRKVQWDSEETHMKAREISGKYLQAFHGYHYFSAILNDQREGQSFANEFFFTQERKALEWLRKK
jgi:hypothetical protein